MSAVVPWSERHTWDAKITMHHATYLVFSFIFTVKLSCFGRFNRTTPIAFATLWGRILLLIGPRPLNNAMWRECSFVRGNENAAKEHQNESGMSHSLCTVTAAPILLRRCRFILHFCLNCALQVRIPALVFRELYLQWGIERPTGRALAARE